MCDRSKTQLDGNTRTRHLVGVGWLVGRATARQTLPRTTDFFERKFGTAGQIVKLTNHECRMVVESRVYAMPCHAMPVIISDTIHVSQLPIAWPSTNSADIYFYMHIHIL